MADDEVSSEFTFPARDAESAQQKAREQHRQFLIDSVWNDEMLPSEAEVIASGTGLLFNGSDGPVTINSMKWSLAQAIVWIAWRDQDCIQEQWWRLYAWSGSLWRDPPAEHQVVTFEQAEKELWAALEDGRVLATGLAGQGSKPVRIEALDWSNLVWMPDKTRLSVRYFGQRDEAYRCVDVKSADVLAVWPAVGMQVPEALQETTQSADSQPRKPDKGGAAPQYDEIDFLIEAFRILYETGRSPASQADLNRRATEAYAASKGLPAGKPSIEWGKENIRRLWIGLGLERSKRPQ